MSEFSGLWKDENNQHALVPPKMECGCPAQVAEELKKRSHTEERRKKIKNYYYYYYLVVCVLLHDAKKTT